MEVNQIVYDRLEKLDPVKKMEFGIFCSERIIGLYSLFDKMVEEEELESLSEDNDGYAVLAAGVDFAKQLDVSKPAENIDTVRARINECVRLIPDDEDYDGGIETALAQLTASSVGYLLEYYLKREDKFIQWSSNAVINVVNNIVSGDYYDNNPDGSYEEKEGILAGEYKKEVAIQLEFISMLENNAGGEEIAQFTEANKFALPE